MVRYSLTFSPFEISGLCEEEQIACEEALHLWDIVKSRRARGDVKAGVGERPFLGPSRLRARSRVLARLASPAQIGELARRLRNR